MNGKCCIPQSLPCYYLSFSIAKRNSNWLWLFNQIIYFSIVQPQKFHLNRKSTNLDFHFHGIVFRTLSNIYDGNIFNISLQLKCLKCFQNKLHHRYLSRFFNMSLIYLPLREDFLFLVQENKARQKFPKNKHFLPSLTHT